MLKAGTFETLRLPNRLQEQIWKLGMWKLCLKRSINHAKMYLKKGGTTTFPFMASSDDVTNGETHSKLQMALACKSFSKFAKLNSFLESAWNSTSDQIRETILFFKVFIGGQPSVHAYTVHAQFGAGACVAKQGAFNWGRCWSDVMCSS